MDGGRVQSAASIEEQSTALRNYVKDVWTCKGVAIQATGRRCFTVTLPQEMQNFDEFVANIRARGGAVDLALSTDSMRCTIWCANAMPKRDGAADGTAGSGILPIQIMTVAAVGLVGVAFAVVQMVHV